MEALSELICASAFSLHRGGGGEVLTRVVTLGLQIAVGIRTALAFDI